MFGSKEERMVQAADGIESWKRGAKLGDGSFASAYIATNNDTGELLVVKTFEPVTIEKKEALEKERRIMMRCSTPYIVKYLGWNVYSDPKRGQSPGENISYNLFMEYIQKGSVLAQIQRNKGKLVEPIVACYVKDVLKGLNYLHTRLDCIHGDVKCENMLVGSNNIILCDLGSGKFMQEGDLVLRSSLSPASTKRLIYTTGTIGWKAPEVEAQERQDYKSDIFSLGCSIVEMATGKPPSKDGDKMPWEQANPDDMGPPTAAKFMPQTFSKMGLNFVNRCLIVDADKRPDTDKLLDHKWIQNALPFPGYRINDTAPKRKKYEDAPLDAKKRGGWLGC